MSRAAPTLLVALLLAGPYSTRSAPAQCLLANPSFEVGGSGGAVFAGWNQFGSVGSSSVAIHGARAARVTSPNAGPWGVSGYWQGLDSAPGDRWIATVHAWHTTTRPLAGQSQAILNVEWRDANGALLGYESHAVLDAATPTGEVRSYEVTSGAAPAGTAAARLVLGVLQGPGDPVADVYYDQATFDEVGPPTLDARQWFDFPGGRELEFSGRNWRVKGPGYYGPGPNLFDDSAGATWVDENGRLHMTVRQVAGSWYSCEVALEDTLGYGDYAFTTYGRLDTLDPTIVCGFYLWQYQACFDPANEWWNPYNEVDVEYSRWGVPGNDLGQFVAQPYNYAGNLDRFALTTSDGEFVTHAFRWKPDRVEFRCWRGGPWDESPATVVHAWTYHGAQLPRPEQPRVHMNLWRFNATPAARQEVVVDRFTFTPLCSGPGCTVDAPGEPPVPAATTVARALPNPFRGQTAIRFALPRAGRVELAIYDVAGRAIRRLAPGQLSAGAHELGWDGRNDAGRRAPPGVYRYRLAAPGVLETGALVLLP